MKFTPGDEVTAVYQLQHQRPMERHVLPLKITETGRKYLHGITLHFDREGIKSEGHKTRVNIEESTIYPGLRHDLRAAEFKYRNDYRKWQHDRQEKKNEVNKHLRKILDTRLKEWETNNPMPQPPELPAQDAEN